MFNFIKKLFNPSVIEVNRPVKDSEEYKKALAELCEPKVTIDFGENSIDLHDNDWEDILFGSRYMLKETGSWSKVNRPDHTDQLLSTCLMLNDETGEVITVPNELINKLFDRI